MRCAVPQALSVQPVYRPINLAELGVWLTNQRAATEMEQWVIDGVYIYVCIVERSTLQVIHWK
jgi:hypothetical protein